MSVAQERNLKQMNSSFRESSQKDQVNDLILIYSLNILESIWLCTQRDLQQKVIVEVFRVSVLDQVDNSNGFLLREMPRSQNDYDSFLFFLGTL